MKDGQTIYYWKAVNKYKLWSEKEDDQVTGIQDKIGSIHLEIHLSLWPETWEMYKVWFLQSEYPNGQGFIHQTYAKSKLWIRLRLDT